MMADIHFEEACPCGNTLKTSGYTSEVRAHVQTWHRVHDKHANAIAKAVAEGKAHPAYYVWPQSTDANPGPVVGAVKQE